MSSLLETRTDETRFAPSPSKISHFVLKTSRFKEMVEWYMTVLMARIVQGTDHIAFFAYDGEHHRLAIVRIDDLQPRPQYACGLDHIAFTYNDLGALLGTYKRLKAAGIEPRWPLNHGSTTSFYYQDPDGNRVELMFENFPSEEETSAYMGGPEFDRNPLGGAFDPEELVRRYESGEEIYSLVRSNQMSSGPSPVEILTEMDLHRT